MAKILLAQILGVKPDQTIKFMVVPLGMQVKAGDLIAEKKDDLGKKIEVRADNAGVLESLSSETGELFIHSLAKTLGGLPERSKTPASEAKSDKVGTEVASHPKKTVSHAPGRGVLAATKGVFGFGSGEGELISYPECLDFTRVHHKLAHHVVLAPTISSNASVYKANALEVAGLVIGFVSEAVRQQLEEEISKKVNLAFLVMSDKEEEAESIFEKIKKLEGKKVRIDGEKKELTLLA